MPRVSPFVGLRYDPSRAGPIDRLTAPPYDLLPPAALERYLAEDPHNVAHLEGGEVERSEAEYREVAARLADWRAGGVLVETESSAFALEMTYPLGERTARVRGILVAMGVEPWGGSVVPHERTSAKPVGDRLRLLRIVGANLSPIHAILPGPSPRLADALGAACGSPALVETTDEEGVAHRLWPLEPAAELRGELEGQSCMIADGHHRYTTALAYREEMRAREGAGPWDDVLTLLVDASEEAPVRAFHRIVLRGPVPEPDEATDDLAATLARLDDEAGVVGVIRPRSGGGVVHGIVRLPGPPPAVVALESLLPKAEEAVRFTPEPQVAEAAVLAGAPGAWLLPPTTAARIRDVVDAGDRLPRKSTYFWPKPRTGLVLRPFR
ncbi:MAG: DUF1015 family protein [Actinomycetota bacterium]